MLPTKKDNPLSLWEHLEELRGHLIRMGVVWMIATVSFYPFAKFFLHYLIKPAGKVVFTSPSEAFLAYMMVTLMGGLCLSLPYLVYEIWRFVASALTEPEKKYIRWLAPLSLLLFVGGIVFAYVFIIPTAISFFLGFASDDMIPMITVSKYISFVGGFCLSFGLVFEMPLVIVFLTKVGIATPEFLIQKRRHAIVVIFIVSAILTPPDYVSQLLMALPLVVLYELSIVFSKMAFRSSHSTQIS